MSWQRLVVERRMLRFGGSGGHKPNYTPSLSLEKRLRRQGFANIAGVDEVGRGAFAGPVVAAAVIFPADFQIPEGFADSKQVRPQKRLKFAELIKKEALAYSIAEVGLTKINKFGIGKAAQIAFRKALKELTPQADFVLIDAFYIRHLNRKNQKPIVKGDEKCASIAAASIIAKVYRDNLMKKLSKKYPEYRLGKNKGYGTREHRLAIRKYGFTRVHRKSFNLSYLISQNWSPSF